MGVPERNRGRSFQCWSEKERVAQHRGEGSRTQHPTPPLTKVGDMERDKIGILLKENGAIIQLRPSAVSSAEDLS